MIGTQAMHKQIFKTIIIQSRHQYNASDYVAEQTGKSLEITDLSPLFNFYISCHIDLIRIYQHKQYVNQAEVKDDIETIVTEAFNCANIRHVTHVFYFIARLYLEDPKAQQRNIYHKIKTLVENSKNHSMTILEFLCDLSVADDAKAEKPCFWITHDQFWNFSSKNSDIATIKICNQANTQPNGQGEFVIYQTNPNHKRSLHRLIRELDPRTTHIHSTYEPLISTHYKAKLTGPVTPDFFIVGIPRTGTSLLSSLINSHPNIYCAQDSGIYSEFSNAMTILVTHQKRINGSLTEDEAKHFVPTLNEAFGEMLKQKVISNTDNESKQLLCVYITNLFRFYIYDFSKPDPRKDRDTGQRYLELINLDELFLKVSTESLNFVDVFNILVGFLANDRSQGCTLVGEKTPLGVTKIDYLKSIYPKAKYINIIRHPFGYYGSRSQRVRTSTLDHCHFYRDCYQNMDTNNANAITVKYEDLISHTQQEIGRIMSFLGVESCNLSDGFEPGVYNKYVGKNIDKQRDINNVNNVDSADRKIIEDSLWDIIEKYYP